MNKAEIKNVIGNLVPDKEMEYRLSEKIVQKNNSKFHSKYMVSIAASLVIVISLGMLGYSFLVKRPDTIPSTISSADGVYIPKIELPKKTNALMDMIGLIVYQGRIYTQSGTNISPESAEKLLGEKLGTTKGNLDEWSRQKDYEVEFASTVGKTDVYSVKGYDRNFRIMTYEKKDGNGYAQFFECLNGITVKNGNDILGKLKMENNIKTAKYEDFESWDNNRQQYKQLTQLQVLNSFVNELKNTIPYSQESLSYLFTDNNRETNQKNIYITLNDGSEVQLMLFKGGYIYYQFSHVFFKMENEAFNKLWDELQ